ncbi:phage tail tape measure protein [Paraclostridium bifermentans]
MNRELTQTEVTMSHMSSNSKFERMNEEIRESERQFLNLKNVTENYGETMRSLAMTQTFYEGQISKTNELMNAYEHEISTSKKKINELEVTVRSLNKAIHEQEQAMKGMSESNPQFEKETVQLEKLKYELTTSTKLLEEHKSRVKELGESYKQSENQLSGLSGKLIRVNKDMDKMGHNLSFEKMEKEIKYLNDVSINNLANKLKELKADFERTNATTDKFDNSMQGLENRLKQYNQMLSVVKKSTKAYGEQIDFLEKELKQTSTEITKVERNLSRYEKQLSSLNRQNDSEKWDRITAKVRLANEEHKKLSEQYSQLSNKLKQAKQGLESNNREFNALSKNIKSTKESVARFRESFKFESIQREVKSLSQQGFDQLKAKIEETNFTLARLENETENLSGSSMGLYQKLRLLRTAYEDNSKLAELYGKELTKNGEDIEKFTRKSKQLEKQLKEMEKVLNSKSLKGEALEKQGEEFKKLEARYKETNNALDGYVKKQKELENSVKQSKSTMSSLNGTIQKTEAQLKKITHIDPFKKVENSLKTLRGQYDLLGAKLENVQSRYKNFEHSIRGNIQASKILKEQNTVLRREYTEQIAVIKRYETTISELKGKQKSLTEEIKKTKLELLQMSHTDGNYVGLNSSLNKMEMELKQVEQEIDKTKTKYHELQMEAIQTDTKLNNNLHSTISGWTALEGKLKSVGSSFVGLGNSIQSVGTSMLPLTMAVTALGGIVVKTGLEFQSSMSRVQAISGATGNELDKLTQKAREMGAKTVWSAKDSADAMNYMAMAGWKTQDMLDGIGGVLNLASAGATDLARTSDIVTDGLTAMGYKAKDTNMFVDVMAQTMASSNTNVEMLGESFKYAGSVAGTYKITVQDLSLALGLMANNGIKASQAGTSFRTGLTRLVAPTDKARAMMEKYNIEVKKNKDGSVNLRDTMVNLREAFSGMKTETGEVDTTMQGLVADTVFGKTAMNGWLSIINSSEGDFNKLADAIDNASGSAELMAKTMNDNLKGDLANLQSVLEESALTIYDSIEPILRQMTQKFTSFIQTLTEKFKGLSPGVQKLIVMFTALSAVIAPLTIALGLFISGLGHTMNAFGAVAGVIGKVSGLFGILNEKFLGVIVQSQTVGGAITSMATKFGLIGGAVGVALIAFDSFWEKAKSKTIKGSSDITHGMSMVEKAMVEPFLKANRQIGATLMTLKATSGKITKDMRQELSFYMGNLANDTTNSLKTISEKSEETLKSSLSNLTKLSEEQITHLQESVKTALDKKAEEVRASESKINEITKKALDERRNLSQDEIRQIEEQRQKINDISLQSMKFFSSNMEQIQKDMMSHLGGLRAEEVASAVANAKEKKDKVIAEATDEYNRLKTLYDLTGKDLNIADRGKLQRAVETARQKKEQVTEQARQEYADVVSYARKSAGESVDAINWSTGELKSTWEIFWDGLKNGVEQFGYNLGLSTAKMDLPFARLRRNLEITGLHIQKFFNNGFLNPEREKELDDQIKKLEQGCKDFEKHTESVGKSIDRLKNLPSGLSVIAKDLNQTLINGGVGKLQEFANLSKTEIDKILNNTSQLPLGVQKDLQDLNDKLISEGVRGGIKQFVEYIRGDIDQVRLEFNDLPTGVQDSLSVLTRAFEESASQVNGITFQEFVLNTKGDFDKVKENASKLPADIQNMIKQINPEEWGTIFKYFSETASQELNNTGEVINQKGQENAEKAKQAGTAQGNGHAEGVRSTVENNRQAGEQINKAVTDQVNAEQGNKAGSELTNGVANGMAQNAGQVATQAGAIKDHIITIDNIRLGNVTKQLSEVNRWLGVISGTSARTRSTLMNLTNIPFGHTTKGLSEINQWLMRTQNRAKDTRPPLMNLTNIPFGNTTKGLSEVNKWLMRTTNRAHDTASALRSITNVRFGGVTSGLSQIAHWLDVVRNKSHSASGAMNSVSVARPKTTGGLGVVKAVQQAGAMAQTALDSMITSASTIDFTSYKTSGGFYEPTSSISKPSNNSDEVDALKSVLKATLEQNNILMQMLTQERPIMVGVNVDGKQIARASAKYMESEINSINNRKSRLGGKF